MTRFGEGLRIVIRSVPILCSITVLLWTRWVFAADELPKGWPKLPASNGAVEIPAQIWPVRPVPRHVKVYIHYPFGRLEHVTAKTGLMLTLHNWGGTEAVGSADPKGLTERFDVVSIAVDFLQSGKHEAFEAEEPYDFGYLQALDALRALWYVQQGLKANRVLFHSGRIYATGGSAGGHVALMCDKLAPRTFTCVIDVCGMTKLSDDIAFGLRAGSNLNARWSKLPGKPNYLRSDEREIRAMDNPLHLAEMKKLGHTAKIIVVHGIDDVTAPFVDAKELVEAMKAANLDVEAVYVNKSHVDGKVYTDSAHTLGSRTEIVFRVADKFIRNGLTTMHDRKTSTDFFRRDEIKYDTTNGAYVISYEKGFPVGKFVPKEQ